MSRVARFLAALLIPLSLLTVPPSPARATAGLTATFTSTDNGSWWQGKYVISNANATPHTGWTLEFDLPPGVHGPCPRYDRAVQLLLRRHGQRRSDELPAQRRQV